MRYPASEKLEIIRLVEHSHLPVKQTLNKLGVPRTTFLSLVRPLSNWRARGSEGSITHPVVLVSR